MELDLLPGVTRKRHRRTKEELAAARAENVGMDGLPVEDTAPKTEKSKSPAPRKKSREEDIATLVLSVNAVLEAAPPLRDDALSDVEALQLVKALDAYQLQNETARRVLVGLMERSATGMLVFCVVGIAIPRLARHGLLPVWMAEGMRRAGSATPGDAAGGGDGLQPSPNPFDGARVYDGATRAHPVYAPSQQFTGLTGE